MARYEHNSNNRGPPSKRGRLEGGGREGGGTRSHARTGTWSPMEVGGCAVTFFIRLRSKFLSEHGFYSLHVGMFWFILRNFIYSHHLLNIRFKICAQFRIQICIQFDEKQMHFLILANIFSSKYFSFEANICKTLSKFHIQANIRLQIFAYLVQANIRLQIFAYKRIFACKYSLANIRILAIFHFVLLQIKKESLSQS
jgi:hypothetical protein